MNYSFNIFRSDTYYIRIRVFNDDINYSQWSDTDATDYWLSNLNFTNISVSYDTITFSKQPRISWSFNTTFNEQYQKYYCLYWKKINDIAFTDSTGLINSSNNFAFFNFKDSGIYEIKLILIDQFDNTSTVYGAHSIFYDTSDIYPPIIEKIYYPQLLSTIDTTLNISLAINDSALLKNEVTIIKKNTVIFYDTFYNYYENIMNITINNLNLQNSDSINIKIICFDANNNSTAINFYIPIFNQLFDYTAPQIEITPQTIISNNNWLTAENYKITITIIDSSNISVVEAYINDSLTFKNSNLINNIFLTQNDSGLIYLKIKASDANNNFNEKTLKILKRNNLNDFTDFDTPAYLTHTSITNLLEASNNCIYNLPDSIIFFFSKNVSIDSLQIYLIDEDKNFRLSLSQISANSVKWQTVFDSLTACESYEFRISGFDNFGKEIDANKNKINFTLLSKIDTTTIINKNSLSIIIPANTFNKDFWVDIKPLSENNAKINAAVANDSSIQILPAAARRFVELTVIDNNYQKISTFNQPVLLKFYYPDNDNNGLIDGASALDEKRLFVTYYNETAAAFVKSNTEQFIDAAKNFVGIYTNSFSIWALNYNSIGANLAESLKIFPTGRYARLSELNKITIRFNAVNNSFYNFKVFSKNGALIKSWSQYISQSGLYSDIEFILTDNNGNKLKTGTYFLFVECEKTGEKYNKAFSLIE